MPISITRDTNTHFEKIECLCADDWELPTQIAALELWLQNIHGKLPSDSYIADVGFDIRHDACGGGAVISVEALRAMADLGMELHLSEYPGAGSAA